MAEHLNAGSRRGRRRRIMRSLKINEISAVDVPAQEGAVAVIMKRKGEPGYDPKAKDPRKRGRAPGSQTEELDVEKGAALTTENAGNTHLVVLTSHNGDEINSGMTSWVDEHSHPWIRTIGDEIVIGAAPASDGEVHTHGIDQMSKVAEGDDDEDAEKRTFTAQQREKLAREGKALPDGSFPIVTKADLVNAISAFGRAGNKAQVARYIKKRARALGLTDLLPEEGRLADLLKGETAGEAGSNVGSKEDGTMADNKDEKTGGDEPTVEELQKKLARADSIAALNDAEKVHLKTLEGDEAEAFPAKSADERKADLEKVAKQSEEDDSVVYKTMDGVELRKSAGEAFIAMAKSNDALRKRLDESEEITSKATLEKRAETELKHLPGDVGTRAAMLKAIDGIEDKTQREAALNALKAQNEAMAKAFDTAGHGGTPPPGSPDDELDTLAKAHQEKHPELTPEQAHAEVLKTERGGELYAKTVN